MLSEFVNDSQETKDNVIDKFLKDRSGYFSFNYNTVRLLIALFLSELFSLEKDTRKHQLVRLSSRSFLSSLNVNRLNYCKEITFDRGKPWQIPRKSHEYLQTVYLRSNFDPPFPLLSRPLNRRNSLLLIFCSEYFKRDTHYYLTWTTIFRI